MDPYYDDSTGAGAFLAVLAVFGFIFFLIAVVAYVVSSFFYMKLFEKAGVEGKWRAWVPVYREMIFAKLGDLSPWWVLVLLGASFVLNLLPYIGPILGWIPSVAFAVYLALAAYRIQLKLQKEAAWVVLYVLLQIVWLGIMGLDRSRWNANVPPAAWAGNFLADTTVWAGIPVQPSARPAAGQAAPGAYPPAGPGAYPPAGYQAPPAGYSAPPAGHQAPPAAQPPVPPQTPPPAAPPVAPPAAPPASTEPPAPTEPPAGPDQPRP